MLKQSSLNEQHANCCNLQRNGIVALQVEKRCCTSYHPPQTLSRNKICCCKLKKFVEKRRRQFNMLLQLPTTKFCCLTMFAMGDNTCNNAFQLATQQCCVQAEEKYIARITGPLLLLQGI